MQQVRSLFAAVLVALAVRVAAAQQQEAARIFKPPATELIARWDDPNGRMLYHHVKIKPSTVGVYAIDAQGRQTIAIDVLKDFPGARQGIVSMNNLAGGPDGGVVLFCILDYGSRSPQGRSLKEAILAYSSSGVLKAAIDTGDYEASALTVDEQGNIYIFATNVAYDVDDPHGVYDTVVKYDPAGHVLKTMLPSSNFPLGEYPADYSDQNGGPVLRVTSKGITVFAALSGRWFLLSKEGEIVVRSDLSRVSRKIADQYHFRRASEGRVFLAADGWPIFEARLDDGPFDAGHMPQPDRVQEPLVKVDPGTLDFIEIEKNAYDGSKYVVGIDKDDHPVFSAIRLDLLRLL